MEYSNKKDLIKILEVDHAYFDGINLKSFLMRVELFSLKKFNKSDPIWMKTLQTIELLLLFTKTKVL